MIVVWVEGHIGSFEESLPRFLPRLGNPGLLGLYLPALPPQVSLKSMSINKEVIFSLPLVPEGRVSVVVVIVEAEDAVVVFVVVAVVDSDNVVVFVVVMVVVVVVVVIGDGVAVGFGVAVGVVVGFAVGVVVGVGVGVVVLRHKPEFFIFLILLGSLIQLFKH